MRISDWSSDVCSSDLHFSQYGADRHENGLPDGNASKNDEEKVRSAAWASFEAHFINYQVSRQVLGFSRAHPLCVSIKQCVDWRTTGASSTPRKSFLNLV